MRLCQDFELFVKFKIYKIKWYKGGLGGGEDRGGESRAKPQSSSHYTNLYIGVVLLGEENDQSFANNELHERVYRHYKSPQLEWLFLG